jgi:hypothetical protein
MQGADRSNLELCSVGDAGWSAPLLGHHLRLEASLESDLTNSLGDVGSRDGLPQVLGAAMGNARQWRIPPCR